ncbi:gdp-mannose transporter gonst1 [Phtheirospermum japonicum]|uniref:Gdp-mannose transporter gonst1 n=1 Tax=Phtheirospermum japonicum TaxID=374723 RepID=A0A830CA40_9LAMI|nr:gdp-mannose transporter gonst1 [Phtheirospermum japonicum]
MDSPNEERSLLNHQFNGSIDVVSSPIRRETANSSRTSLGTKAPISNDDTDIENGKLEKDRERNFVSVVIVSILSFLGIITTEPLTWRLIKVWLPVNFIFVGMLVTSMFSLKYINVAMVTVLKNVTNVITAVGEMYLFNKHHDNRVWAALFLMLISLYSIESHVKLYAHVMQIISAISGGFTDLAFHAVGYTWQFLNCFLTASYSLTLRRVMDTAKQVTKSGELNEFSMVMLNNSLSLPLGIFLIFVFNEIDYLSQTPLLRLPTFWLVMTFSGLLGLAISFTSMWFLHQTGATTYRVIKQDSSFGCWDPSFQCPNKLGKFCKYFLWLVSRSAFRKSKDALKIRIMSTSLFCSALYPLTSSIYVTFVMDDNVITLFRK